jgi:alpha-L-fucosidase 2
MLMTPPINTVTYHLWGMYPGHEINWDESPELMKTARQSLLYRGDAATG